MHFTQPQNFVNFTEAWEHESVSILCLYSICNEFPRGPKNEYWK